MRTRLSVISLLASSLLLAASCNDDDDDEVQDIKTIEKGTQVAVTVREFAISVQPNSVPAGDVTFDVENTGSETHEFVVIKTDIDEGDLPLKEGKVNDDAAGLDEIDEVEDIHEGQTKHLSVSLDAGKYVLICNREEDLPDGGSESHYQEGMHVAFNVE